MRLLMKGTINICVVVLTAISILFMSCLYKQVQRTETFYDTEYRTEYKAETYSETETVVVQTEQGKEPLRPVVQWGGYDTIYRLPGINAVRYYGYHSETVQHTSNKIKITIDRGALNQKGVITVYDGLGNIPVIPTPIYALSYHRSPEQQQWIDWVIASMNGTRVLGQMTINPYIGMDIYKVPNEIVFDAKDVNNFGVFANTYYYDVVYKVESVWSDEVTQQKTVTRGKQIPYQVPVQVEKQKTVTDVVKVPFWEVLFNR